MHTALFSNVVLLETKFFRLGIVLLRFRPQQYPQKNDPEGTYKQQQINGKHVEDGEFICIENEQNNSHKRYSIQD